MKEGIEGGRTSKWVEGRRERGKRKGEEGRREEEMIEGCTEDGDAERKREGEEGGGIAKRKEKEGKEQTPLRRTR